MNSSESAMRKDELVADFVITYILAFVITLALLLVVHP